jgi:hypothetical protein
MSPRQAFRIFIRHQLETMQEDGTTDLTAEELENFANGIEDDYDFYKAFDEFLVDFINDFGENYGIK